MAKLRQLVEGTEKVYPPTFEEAIFERTSDNKVGERLDYKLKGIQEDIEEVNDNLTELTTYSTEEKKVGKYLDKDLYAKTIIYSSNIALSANTPSNTVIYQDTNIDRIIRYEGFVDRYYGGSFTNSLPLPDSTAYASAGQYFYRVCLLANKSIQLACRSTNEEVLKNVNLTIYYTKL